MASLIFKLIAFSEEVSWVENSGTMSVEDVFGWCIKLSKIRCKTNQPLLSPGGNFDLRQEQIVCESIF